MIRISGTYACPAGNRAHDILVSERIFHSQHVNVSPLGLFAGAARQGHWRASSVMLSHYCTPSFLPSYQRSDRRLMNGKKAPAPLLAPLGTNIPTLSFLLLYLEILAQGNVVFQGFNRSCPFHHFLTRQRSFPPDKRNVQRLGNCNVTSTNPPFEY